MIMVFFNSSWREKRLRGDRSYKNIGEGQATSE